MKKAYFQVYTGNGKGKTTAALGVAFRAFGHGLHTYIGQFMKGRVSGEVKACKFLPSSIVIERYGKKSFVETQGSPQEEDRRMARFGLEKARDAMCSGNFDIVVFDEILTAHHLGLITLEEVLHTADMRPLGVELIFTGRYAPKEVIEKADLVTEMKEIKHYYHKGVEARKGIEK